MNLWCPTSAIVFVFLYCVIIVINKHNKLKQKRSQNEVTLRRYESSEFAICLIQREVILDDFVNERFVDFELKKVLPPLGNCADISYLEEKFKPHLLRDVCTLCSGALVSDSLLHMLL